MVVTSQGSPLAFQTARSRLVSRSRTCHSRCSQQRVTRQRCHLQPQIPLLQLWHRVQIPRRLSPIRQVLLPAHQLHLILQRQAIQYPVLTASARVASNQTQSVSLQRFLPTARRLNSSPTGEASMVNAHLASLIAWRLLRLHGASSQRVTQLRSQPRYLRPLMLHRCQDPHKAQLAPRSANMLAGPTPSAASQESVHQTRPTRSRLHLLWPHHCLRQIMVVFRLQYRTMRS